MFQNLYETVYIFEIALGISSSHYSTYFTKNYDNPRSEISSSPFKGNEHITNEGFPSSRSCVYGTVSAGCFETVFSEVRY